MLERVVAMGVVITLIAAASAIVNADEAVPPGQGEVETERETPMAVDATAKIEKPEEKERKKKDRKGHDDDHDDEDDRDEEDEEKRSRKGGGKKRSD